MSYNLVLVDDEDWILSGIQNAIEWEEIGFTVVGTYTNGRDALAAMKNNPPDALLTDIKMPIQDGISLVRELREAGLNDLEVVFLSGYDDFELAQSSLRLGAVDYVLKPSAPEQIMEVFSRIRERIDERKRLEEEKREAAELVEAGVKVFKDAIYNSIISGSRQRYDRLLSLYSEFVAREKGRPYFIVSVALSKTASEEQPDLEDMAAIQRLKELSLQCREEQKKGVYLMKNQFSASFVFSGFDEDVVEGLMEGLKRRLRKETGQILLIARSEVYSDFRQIWDAYDVSIDRLFQFSFSDSVRQLYLSMGNDTVLRAAVEDKDQQVILWSLKNWFVKIDKVEKEYQERLMRRLIYTLSVFFLQNGIVCRAVAGLYEALSAGGCSAAKEAVISSVKSEFLPENGVGGKNAHLCREVAKYISKNYTDDITLNDLADRFYISPNYLGTLFKKNMGIGIREYQTTIRLEQADALIASGKFKMYQVACMVGYPNYEYFRKIYCKYRGKNPSE